jgi:hypothetical protein
MGLEHLYPFRDGNVYILTRHDIERTVRPHGVVDGHAVAAKWNVYLWTKWESENFLRSSHLLATDA